MEITREKDPSTMFLTEILTDDARLEIVKKKVLSIIIDGWSQGKGEVVDWLYFGSLLSI